MIRTLCLRIDRCAGFQRRRRYVHAVHDQFVLLLGRSTPAGIPAGTPRRPRTEWSLFCGSGNGNVTGTDCNLRLPVGKMETDGGIKKQSDRKGQPLAIMTKDDI